MHIPPPSRGMAFLITIEVIIIVVGLYLLVLTDWPA